MFPLSWTQPLELGVPCLAWAHNFEWVVLVSLCVVLGGLLLAALARATVLAVEATVLAIVRHRQSYGFIDDSQLTGSTLQKPSMF